MALESVTSTQLGNDAHPQPFPPDYVLPPLTELPPVEIKPFEFPPVDTPPVTPSPVASSSSP
jgi:hypothetical protein